LADRPLRAGEHDQPCGLPVLALVGTLRRELLDRGLIWDHLRRILRDYETHHNQHRPHRSLHGAASLKPLPESADLDLYRVRKYARVGGLINEYRLVA
jgi:putative transposase